MHVLKPILCALVVFSLAVPVFADGDDDSNNDSSDCDGGECVAQIQSKDQTKDFSQQYLMQIQAAQSQKINSSADEETPAPRVFQSRATMF